MPKAGLYLPSFITPYIHSLINHFPELIRRHGPIYHMSCQSLELRNGKHNASYYRSSSRRSTADAEILIQDFRPLVNPAVYKRERFFCGFCSHGEVTVDGINKHLEKYCTRK